MKTCRGINCLGFNDSINGQHAEYCEEGIPATVVLTRVNDNSVILTGKDATNSRVETGFHWPLESQLDRSDKGKNSATIRHRFPIPLLWERLVNNRDKISAVGELAGRGTQWVEKLLHAHIAPLCHFEEGSLNILAIPNTLSTAAQEKLLRTFNSREQIKLLWRPVAATFDWLEQIPRKNFVEDGWVAVIYLGLDDFEFTRIQLDTQHPDYVIPTRSRPKRVRSQKITGFDVAYSTLKNQHLTFSFEEAWQGLLRFPAIWNWLRCGDTGPFSPEKCLYSRNREWDLWHPHFQGIPYGVLPLHTSAELTAITNRKLDESSRAIKKEQCHELLCELLQKNFPSTDGCLGMILCGPLAPYDGLLPSWLDQWAKQANLRLSSSPVLGGIYRPSVDIISRGCQIYGERLLWNEEHPNNRIPTYYDTLPQISLQVSDKENLIWKPLFEESHCEGGQTAHNTLWDFSLRANSDFVDIWLQMSDEDDDPADTLEETPYRYSLVRFLKSYPELVPLELVASMQPSSGYATVFFKAAQKQCQDIVRGDGVHLNFEEMIPKLLADLPKENRAYPKVGHRLVLSRNLFWERRRIEKALQNCDYRALWRRLRYGEGFAADRKYLFGFDGEQYLFSGKELTLFQQEFERIAADRFSEWESAASWMWAACPPKIKQKILHAISNPTLRNLDHYGYASRVVSTPEETSLFWEVTKIMARDAHYAMTMKSNFAREFARFVNFRAEATQLMSNSPSTVNYMLSALDSTIHRKSIFSKFAATNYASLLGVLLRARQINSDFLRGTSDIARWEENLNLLVSGFREYLEQKDDGEIDEKSFTRTKKYIESILDYLKGCGNDVPIVIDLDDMEEGSTED